MGKRARQRSVGEFAKMTHVDVENLQRSAKGVIEEARPYSWVHNANKIAQGLAGELRVGEGCLYRAGITVSLSASIVWGTALYRERAGPSRQGG